MKTFDLYFSGLVKNSLVSTSVEFFVALVLLGVVGGCSTTSQPSVNLSVSRTTEQTPAAAAASLHGVALVKSAEAAYAKGDWRVAATEYKKLTELYPRNSQMWFSLGTSYALLGSLDESAKSLETSVSLDPRDARAAYNLALVRLNQAEFALKSAEVNVQPTSPLKQEITKILSGIKTTFSAPPLTTGAQPLMSTTRATADYAVVSDKAETAKPITNVTHPKY